MNCIKDDWSVKKSINDKDKLVFAEIYQTVLALYHNDLENECEQSCNYKANNY